MSPNAPGHWAFPQRTLSGTGMLYRASANPRKLVKFPPWDSGPGSLTTAVSSFPQTSRYMCYAWLGSGMSSQAPPIPVSWLTQSAADRWTPGSLNLHTRCAQYLASKRLTLIESPAECSCQPGTKMATIMPSHKTAEYAHLTLTLPACTPGPHQGQRIAMFTGSSREGKAGLGDTRKLGSG